jgi:molybdate-binding protein/DNA-binding XRE family transcriptional regulator
MDTSSHTDISVENNVAEMRRKRGIAAADLARRTGISRPTIYAIEAGKYVPNTAVALRMAHVLETTVEELFSVADETAAKPATAAPELIPSPDFARGAAVRLCRVDDRLLAVASPVEAWQLPPGDAVLRSTGSRSRRATVACFDERDIGEGILIAGCDPAVSILARHLERGGIELVPARSNSSDALQLLRQRKVHIAGTHLPDQSRVKRLFPAGSIAVIVFATWEEGLVVAAGNPLGIRSAADLAHSGVRLANREPGSACRLLLDEELKHTGVRPSGISGYDRSFPGHVPAARQVKSGLADCCVATRSAALACGLDFVPLASRRYDLVLRTEHLGLASVERMLNVVSSTRFRRELETLAGYDTRETGRRVV